MAHEQQLNDKALKSQFDENGYVIIKNFFQPEEMSSLLECIKTAKTADEDDSKNVLSKGAMIFRTNVFAQNTTIQSFISQQKVVDLLKPIAGPDIWTRWDQAVGKGPGSGTFPWHQDNAYSQLIDQHYQLWIALTKASEKNGALWLQPGSNRKGNLPHGMIDKHAAYEGDVIDRPIFIETEPGDVVIFSSLTLHSTTPNVTKNQTRWAYVVEYMSLKHFDPTIPPPYFIVARGGKSAASFTDNLPGNNLINRLRYKLHPVKRKLLKLVRLSKKMFS